MTDDTTTPTAEPRGVTAEHARLAEATGAAEDDLFDGESLVRVGAVPVGAGLGHGSGGLQRQWRRVGVFSA